MARPRKVDPQSVGEMFDGIRADYDAAKKTRFKRTRMGIAAGGSGADYHYRNWNDYAKIIETARDLFRNHQLVGQGIRRLVSNILRGGFTLDTKTGDTGLDAELSARWYSWAEDADACDIQGESNFHELEKLTLQQVVVDGDCFSLPTVDGQIQQIEAHRVRTPSGTKKNVVHGVLLDEMRRRLEYWVTKDDIDALATLSKVSDIRAYQARDIDELTGKQERQVYHHYMKDRTTQTRGITALVPVVDTAGMADDLNFATLVKAQMAACVTIFRELAGSVSLPPAVGNDGIPTTADTRPDGTTRLLAGWQPGMEIFGFPGEKLSGFSPNVPNAEYFQHSMFLLSIIAVNLDLPVAVLMLDPSKTNFSGWRGAMDQARQRFQEIQQWLIGSLHCPTYRWKVRQWATEDAGIRRAIEQTVRRVSGVDAFGHVWHAQEWPYIEPIADAQGDVIQERNLLISPRRRAARRGMDFQELIQEIMEDRERIILTAHEAAQRINTAIGEDLTWRDLAIFGPPEGVTVSQSKSESESTVEPADTTETPDAKPSNRLLERVNGHAN